MHVITAHRQLWKMRVPLLYGRCKHHHRPVVDPGGPGPPYFWTKLRLKVPKNQTRLPPPYLRAAPLSEGVDPPLQIEELLLTNQTLQLTVT